MYNKRKRWRRLERLIKNVMIPFAETALLIISQQQAYDSHTIYRRHLIFLKVRTVVVGPRVHIMKMEARKGELGVSEHRVSP